MYIGLDGIWSIFALIGFILIMRKFSKLRKLSLSNAKKQFLAKPEVQAYIKDGYEIVKITDKGNGIYNFELSKKINHS